MDASLMDSVDTTANEASASLDMPSTKTEEEEVAVSEESAEGNKNNIKDISKKNTVNNISPADICSVWPNLLKIAKGNCGRPNVAATRFKRKAQNELRMKSWVKRETERGIAEELLDCDISREPSPVPSVSSVESDDPLPSDVSLNSSDNEEAGFPVEEPIVHSEEILHDIKEPAVHEEDSDTVLGGLVVRNPSKKQQEYLEIVREDGEVIQVPKKELQRALSIECIAVEIYHEMERLQTQTKESIYEQMEIRGIRRSNDVTQLYMVGRNFKYMCDMSEFKNLRILYLNSNNLRRLGSALHHSTGLCELYLQDNELTSTDGLKYLSVLRILMLHNNQLENLEKIVHSLRHMVSLDILSLFNNPCAQEADYRKYTVYHLPAIKTLDRQEIGEEERIEGYATYEQDRKLIKDRVAFGGGVQSVIPLEKRGKWDVEKKIFVYQDDGDPDEMDVVQVAAGKHPKIQIDMASLNVEESIGQLRIAQENLLAVDPAFGRIIGKYQKKQKGLKVDKVESSEEEVGKEQKSKDKNIQTDDEEVTKSSSESQEGLSDSDSDLNVSSIDTMDSCKMDREHEMNAHFLPDHSISDDKLSKPSLDSLLMETSDDDDIEEAEADEDAEEEDNQMDDVVLLNPPDIADRELILYRGGENDPAIINTDVEQPPVPTLFSVQLTEPEPCCIGWQYQDEKHISEKICQEEYYKYEFYDRETGVELHVDSESACSSSCSEISDDENQDQEGSTEVKAYDDNGYKIFPVRDKCLTQQFTDVLVVDDEKPDEAVIDGETGDVMYSDPIYRSTKLHILEGVKLETEEDEYTIEVDSDETSDLSLSDEGSRSSSADSEKSEFLATRTNRRVVHDDMVACATVYASDDPSAIRSTDDEDSEDTTKSSKSSKTSETILPKSLSTHVSSTTVLSSVRLPHAVLPSFPTMADVQGVGLTQTAVEKLLLGSTHSILEQEAVDEAEDCPGLPDDRVLPLVKACNATEDFSVLPIDLAQRKMQAVRAEERLEITPKCSYIALPSTLPGTPESVTSSATTISVPELGSWSMLSLLRSVGHPLVSHILHERPPLSSVDSNEGVAEEDEDSATKLASKTREKTEKTRPSVLGPRLSQKSTPKFSISRASVSRSKSSLKKSSIKSFLGTGEESRTSIKPIIKDRRSSSKNSATRVSIEESGKALTRKKSSRASVGRESVTGSILKTDRRTSRKKTVKPGDEGDSSKASTPHDDDRDFSMSSTKDDIEPSKKAKEKDRQASISTTRKAKDGAISPENEGESARDVDIKSPEDDRVMEKRGSRKESKRESILKTGDTRKTSGTAVLDEKVSNTSRPSYTKMSGKVLNTGSTSKLDSSSVKDNLEEEDDPGLSKGRQLKKSEGSRLKPTDSNSFGSSHHGIGSYDKTVSGISRPTKPVRSKDRGGLRGILRMKKSGKVSKRDGPQSDSEDSDDGNCQDETKTLIWKCLLFGEDRKQISMIGQPVKREDILLTSSASGYSDNSEDSSSSGFGSLYSQRNLRLVPSDRSFSSIVSEETKEDIKEETDRIQHERRKAYDYIRKRKTHMQKYQQQDRLMKNMLKDAPDDYWNDERLHTKTIPSPNLPITDEPLGAAYEPMETVDITKQVQISKTSDEEVQLEAKIADRTKLRSKVMYQSFNWNKVPRLLEKKENNSKSTAPPQVSCTIFR